MTSSVAGVSFEVPEATQLLLESLHEFIEQEVKTREQALGETLTNPRRRHEIDGRLVPEVRTAISDIRQASADAGYYAMNLPEAVGGEDVSLVTWYRAKKHVSASASPLAKYALAGPEGPKPLLLQATGDQVDRYLRPTVQGKKTTAFAQTEPGVGSDSPNMSTTAERDGDEWVLNGQKQWITNAPYADFIQVFARTTPQAEAGRHGGITCFLVENDEYEVGAMNNAVGMEGWQAELRFDDVRLPDDRVLGTPDQAFYAAMDFLSLGRLELGAEAVGHAEFLIEQAREYATEREAFGQPIGEFQGISHQLAKAYAKTDAADAAGLWCAYQMATRDEAVLASSAFKWFATNVLWETADAVVGVHGANGLAEENQFMDRLEQARILRIVEGTDEIQLNTIAKRLGITQ